MKYLGLLSFILLCNFFATGQYLTNVDYALHYGDLSTGNFITHSKSLLQGDYLYHISYTAMPTDGTAILVKKHHIDGTLEWESTYGPIGSIQDYGADLKVDNSGNVYAVGAIENGPNGYDIAVIKFNSSGLQQWAYEYNSIGATDDIPASLDVDATGNVYVTGRTGTSGDYDAITLKISSTGLFDWSQTYNYDGKDDGGFLVDYTSSGEVIVLAITEGDGFQKELSKIHYNSVGMQQAAHRTNLVLSNANITDIEFLSGGNILVGGWQDHPSGHRDLAVYKLNSNLSLSWSYTHDESGYDDQINAFAIDASENVYFCGSIEQNQNEPTIVAGKLNSSGTQQWLATYDYPVHFDATGTCISLDTDHLFISGHIQQTSTNSDVINILIDNSNGELEWRKEWDNEGQELAKANFITDDLEVISAGLSINDESFVVKYEIFFPDNNIVEETDHGDRLDKQVIVSFKPGVLTTDFLDNTEIMFADFSEIVSASDLVTLQSGYNSIVDLNKTTVSKIFNQFTSTDTVVVTNDSDSIYIPPFWNTVLLHFEDSVDEDSVLFAGDSMLFDLIEYNSFNCVGPTTDDWVPNDPYFLNNQSGLQAFSNTSNKGATNITKAWDIETGLESVRVGIYDTGVNWRLQEFTTSTTGGLAGSKFDDGYDYILQSAIGRSNVDIANTVDVNGTNAANNGHGTLIAGTIGAQTNNQANNTYVGIAGIAGGDGTQGGATLRSYRVIGALGVGSLGGVAGASTAELANAIANGRKVVNGSRIHLSNHSYGDFTNSDETFLKSQEILRYQMWLSARVGITMITTSGNDGLETHRWPANYFEPGIIKVGCSDNDGRRLDISNYGFDLDLLAPGTDDQNTFLLQNGSYSNADIDDYLYSSTSFAAPVVTGVATLLISNWTRSGQQTGSLGAHALYPDDIEWILEQSARDLTYNPNGGIGTGYDDETGWGIVDAYKALQLIERPNFYVDHFHTKISLDEDNDLVESNHSVTMRGHWKKLSNDQEYKVDIYELEKSIKVPIPAGYTLVKTNSPQLGGLTLQNDGYWPAHTQSTVMGYDPSTDKIWGHDGLEFSSPPTITTENGIDYLEATVKGYVFYVKKEKGLFGNSIKQWYPHRYQNQFTMAFSALFVSKSLGAKPAFGDDNSGLVVYPNPSSGKFFIQSYFNQKPVFCIYNAQGQQMSVNVQPIGGNSYELDLSMLAGGMYILKSTVNGTTTTLKLLKE